jgi:Radical SAM superfamily/Iron-sulfur cluster-binding domain
MRGGEAVTAKTPSRVGAIALPVQRLHVELTNRCNFSCEFCPDRSMRRPRGTMPLPMVESLLAEAGQGGLARQVHFHVMGEPLCSPLLPEAVRLARRNGMEAWVVTNGSLLSPPRLAELQAAGLSHLTISLQTPDAPTFACRGSGLLSFEQYRDGLIGAIRVFLAQPSGMHLTICFLSNPLRRFHAPGASSIRVAESGKELRAHMGQWVEWIFGGTALEGQLPRLLAQVKRTGILKECRLPLTEGLDFQVRALGNWAGHFEGPSVPARFGYCPALTENFGILWNGDYVICCADYDGRTVLANFSETPLREYLSLPAVQEIADGFRRYRVVHAHCRQCLGDGDPVNSFLRQAGSIAYFKVYRKLMTGDRAERKAV